MTKFNHAFDLGFEVISEDPNGATNEEIIKGLEKRLKNLKNDLDEVQEACGLFDTYEIED